MFKYLRVILPTILIICIPLNAQEEWDEDSCVDCHEESVFGTDIETDVSHSIHDGLGCLDCHLDRGIEHDEDTESDFFAGCEGCRDCHEESSDDYQAHGTALYGGDCEDMPHCSDCHGEHNVLAIDNRNSMAHPTNLPSTCGKCHEDIDLTTKYGLYVDHPVEIYETSIHGEASKQGTFSAATCNDCHSTKDSSHKIYSHDSPESSIYHFNIPETCGKCHEEAQREFEEGIHGILVSEGYTDSPVCTHCHGEHGIINADDPRSPVSKAKVSELTCVPCHESVTINEKYGLPEDRIKSFIDSYHGLKSQAGDTHVANCASCHGVHKILPSDDEESTIHLSNLQKTCGECHPQISARVASTSIHGFDDVDLRNPIAVIIEKIYIILIIVVIGGMLLHWVIDLFRQVRQSMKKPQIRRMHKNELIQHTLNMITFIVLVISGFALRFGDSFIAKFFFGWEGGFELRGLIHRIAAVSFIIVTLWHLIYILFTERGKKFFKDMLPGLKDLAHVYEKVMYNLGRREEPPKFARFGYVEKAEYWAIIWGTVVMIVTGILLWFDNYFSQFLPQVFLDISLVIHYWEAWLATLAIAVWHLYSTLFNPEVAPMNTSWLTGKMPEDLYKHEHPLHFEEAKEEAKMQIRKDMDAMSLRRKDIPPKEK